MISDELEALDEVDLFIHDYLREVRQERLYQQLNTNQSNLLQRILIGS